MFNNLLLNLSNCQYPDSNSTHDSNLKLLQNLPSRFSWISIPPSAFSSGYPSSSLTEEEAQIEKNLVVGLTGLNNVKQDDC